MPFMAMAVHFVIFITASRCHKQRLARHNIHQRKLCRRSPRPVFVSWLRAKRRIPSGLMKRQSRKHVKPTLRLSVVEMGFISS